MHRVAALQEAIVTTYYITERYEPENHDVIFTIEGLPAYAFGCPVEPPEDESFRVRPYDHKMTGLYKKQASYYEERARHEPSEPYWEAKSARYSEGYAFQAKYSRQMMQRARGAVYLVGDEPALTKPYAVFAGLYDITQTHDLIHSGDRFIFKTRNDDYEFILEGAWIEGSPGGRAAIEDEHAERTRRGFSADGHKSTAEIKRAIWEDATSELQGGPAMARKIGSIGDVNPIEYGGGPILTASGSGGPWVEYFDGLESVAPDADEDEDLDLEVMIYRVDLHEDAKRFLSWYNWVEWEKVASSTGQDAEDYTNLTNLRTAQGRALAIQDAAGYYGWHEFDQDPLQLTLGKLKQRWDEE
jgi:hypothetical protein